MIAWEFAWADSVLVVLDEWSSYRGGRLNRFECTCLDETMMVFKGHIFFHHYIPFRSGIKV